MSADAWRETYRVVGDDHAVEQRADGVEAAHVQAWGAVKNTDESKEKALKTQMGFSSMFLKHPSRSGAAERSRVRRPRTGTFSKTEPRRNKDFYKRFSTARVSDRRTVPSSKLPEKQNVGL